MIGYHYVISLCYGIREALYSDVESDILFHVQGADGQARLESAINAIGHVESEANFAEVSARLFCGIIRAHGLVDGNKRLAFVALHAQMVMYNQILQLPGKELAELAVAVASGNIGVETVAKEIRPWIYAADTKSARWRTGKELGRDVARIYERALRWLETQ